MTLNDTLARYVWLYAIPTQSQNSAGSKSILEQNYAAFYLHFLSIKQKTGSICKQSCAKDKLFIDSFNR